MRIAILLPYWNPPHFHGGISRVIFELRKRWLAKGHTVHLYSANTTTNEEEGTFHVPVPRMPLRTVLVNCYLHFTKKLEPYDIVFPQSAIQCLFVDKKKCFPYIHTLSAIEDTQSWRLWRRLFPFIETVALKDIKKCLVLSDDSTKLLTQEHNIPREVIIKTINGVDPERYKPQQNDTENVKIFTAGRFIDRKRISLLIKAIPLVLQHDQNIELSIAGTGPLAAKLKELTSQLSLENHVRFLGQLNQDKMLAEYQHSDIFVLPSASEGMPMVVLEAMACGLPIIISNFSSADELVINGKNGYILKNDSEEELSQLLTDIIRNQELRYAMGQASRECILKHFSWEYVSANIENMLIEFHKNA